MKDLSSVLKRVSKLLAVALATCGAAACGTVVRVSEQQEIDGQLLPYAKTVAEWLNLDSLKTNRILLVDAMEIYPSAGRCTIETTSYSDGRETVQRTVRISEVIWSWTSEASRHKLLAHELVHCEFGKMEHSNNPDDLMYPSLDLQLKSLEDVYSSVKPYAKR